MSINSENSKTEIKSDNLMMMIVLFGFLIASLNAILHGGCLGKFDILKTVIP